MASGSAALLCGRAAGDGGREQSSSKSNKWDWCFRHPRCYNRRLIEKMCRTDVSRMNLPVETGTNPTGGTARNAGSWRLGILLLLVSLLSVAALAKRSFALPRSSPAHWVSQTCKMREARRVASPHAAILRAFTSILRGDQPRPRVIATRESDPPPTATPGFFRHATLRGPPTV